MKEYYAYYSYGGYKDMWLGNDKTFGEHSYYSPFLDSDLESLGFPDELLDQLRKQIDELKKKTLICVEKAEADSSLANVHLLIANRGYKIAFLRLSNGRFAVIIRDINGEMKDDVGRSIPFVLYLAIDGEKDAVTIVNYLMENLRKIDIIFGSLFEYDAVLNSLSFNLSEMNNIMDEASRCVKKHFSLIEADDNAMLMIVTNNLSIVDKVLRTIPVKVNRCQFFDYSLCPYTSNFGQDDFRPTGDSTGRKDNEERKTLEDELNIASYLIKKLEDPFRNIAKFIGNMISKEG